ncbi:hypothetical protein SEA_JKSYNGBOY_3 [Gordonia phage JKSyngboy]|uniref:Uncharacterized protein n=1 Tax=Gordonia phage JKSyngboy TaxID=2762400 RepID=A0A7G8LL55_9CAUD|nr:hypothetical protein J1762_gp03 [Gordonia phage JKSyngboy]QNJ57977.1 hypothetical protein SEA_JKSYNGBOY_3 [Gordonia phage JKSyngboy]UAJ15671.1 hypothetical protein SEA_BADDON_3 [Gordonia phage Baddon]WMI33014.1 hypothetical protein SEA_SCHOTTB_3 [Gordonia Phage SchottB]
MTAHTITARDLHIGDRIAAGERLLTQVTVDEDRGVVAVYGIELDADGNETDDTFGGEFAVTDQISVARPMIDAADQAYADTFEPHEVAAHYMRAVDPEIGTQIVLSDLDNTLGEIRIVNPDGSSSYVILDREVIDQIGAAIAARVS